MADANAVAAFDLVVGSTLGWNIFDVHGKVLLEEGSVISSERELQLITNYELYMQDTFCDNTAIEADWGEHKDPFTFFYYFADSLTVLFSDIEKHSDIFISRMEELSKELQVACETDADALLGAVHLCFDHSYFITHSISVAILCELMGIRLGKNKFHRASIISAALTSNLGMKEFQDALQNQPEKLSFQQKEAIKIHPEVSIQILNQVGVSDQKWLKAVEHHHERINGSGYPHALKGDDIYTDGRMIGILDRYTAMISARSYRDSLHANDVLKSVLEIRGKEYDEKISLLLIKELGFYPPGVFVRLTNGETAVVIRRGEEVTDTFVASVMDSSGKEYTKPFRRKCCDESSFEIEQPAIRDKDLKLNLSELWGYE